MESFVYLNPPAGKVMNLIIGLTGSVATIKINLLIQEINSKFPNISIKIVCTENSLKFFYTNEIPKSIPVYRDQDEWVAWNKISDPVLHIELRNWADAILIAPLDANTMGKICSGMCDNLLTCLLRAWDMKNKGGKIFLAPAMNTAMWNHPITEEHLKKLKLFSYNIIDPVEKRLACGDQGIGGMESVEKIVSFMKNKLDSLEIETN